MNAATRSRVHVTALAASFSIASNTAADIATAARGFQPPSHGALDLLLEIGRRLKLRSERPIDVVRKPAHESIGVRVSRYRSDECQHGKAENAGMFEFFLYDKAPGRCRPTSRARSLVKSSPGQSPATSRKP